MKKLIIPFFSLAVLFSCTNEDNSILPLTQVEPTEALGFSLDEDEAKELLLDYMNSDTKTKGNINFSVLESEASYHYFTSFKESVKGYHETDSVLVYSFTTKSDNNTGYSVVLGDKRIQKVLIQVENGSLNDTLNIPPLKEYFRSIPEIIRKDLNKYSQGIKSSFPKTKADNVVAYYAFLPTVWGQEYPYNAAVNFSCTTLADSYQGKAPAGCVPIAIAQILAYYKLPSNLNWTEILKSQTLKNNPTQLVINQVSNLIKDIGTKIKIDYGCDGSGISSSLTAPVVTGLFNSYGLTHTGLKNFDLYGITSSLISKRPVYMRGGNIYGVGHAWVCDGYKRHEYSSGDSYHYLSMNWGWSGNSNGFYYTEEDSPSFFAGSSNYNYNLQYIGDFRK